MSYSIVTTPGFVISSQPYGEAGKLLHIFTRELGLVLATAQGIRLEKSKLRYSSQEYSLAEFSFVRGKEFWRMTNVTALGLEKVNTWALTLEARLAALLKRFLQGEQANPELFDAVLAFVKFAAESADLEQSELEALESLVMARVLDRLGYIGNDEKLTEYLKNDDIGKELLWEVYKMKKVFIGHINRGLKESHL